MMASTNLFYLFVWLGLSILCFIFSKTVSKILLPAGAYFAFVFIWRVAELFLPQSEPLKLIYDSIFTVVSVIALITILIMYFRSRKR